MGSWWAEGSQPRNSLGHHVPLGWGLRGARVSMEAGPLTLAVGEVEVEYRSHRQLSKPRSGGWQAAELGNGGEEGVRPRAPGCWERSLGVRECLEVLEKLDQILPI